MSASFNNSTLTITRTQPNQTELQVRMVFLWLIIAVGLISNALIFAVIKTFHSMRTTTNYLLVNVAAADITTLIFTAIHLLIPVKQPFPTGFLGSFLCKFIYTNNITMVTLLVTTLTLTLLAVERYNAMMKPLIATRRISTDKIAYFLTGIWMASIIMATPLFVSVDHRPNSPHCSPGDDSDKMRVYVTVLIVTLTLAPFFGIVFCYYKILFGLYCSKTICSRASEVSAHRSVNEKKRLLIVLVVLTGVFFVAFVPYGVVLILKFNGLTSKYSSHFRVVFFRLKLGVQYLTLLNCSLNPFIYAIPSTNYRCCLKYMVKKIFCQDTEQEYEATELRRRKTVSSI